MKKILLGLMLIAYSGAFSQLDNFNFSMSLDEVSQQGHTEFTTGLSALIEKASQPTKSNLI